MSSAMLTLSPRLLPSSSKCPGLIWVRGRHDLKKIFPVVQWAQLKRDRRPKSGTHIHGESDNSDFKVDGVSDRQYPIMLDWRRPEWVTRTRPGSEGSGDMSGLPSVPPSDPVLRMEGVKEFQEGSELLKKVKSIEFAWKKDKIERQQRDLRRLVQRHKLDTGSLEVEIARKTGIIRRIQGELDEQDAWDTKTRVRAVLKFKVDERRAMLRRLRENDYKRFEWLLERLDLVYKPRPFHYETVEREKHLTRLVDMWCDELKQHRLDELKDKLKREQPGYLRNKAETLRWAKKEQQDLGLEVTVDDAEIEECLKRADEIEAEIRKMDSEVEGGREYFAYVHQEEDTSQKYTKSS